MISNARGIHSSPGVYIEEVEKTYAPKSLGITTLGLVGETLKGPAFEPIRISNWTEFQEYFGGTSTEKFAGTGYPKYELPYIAKSYLQESKQLDVCRVLGFSGYIAGQAWLITVDNTVFGVIRSKASYAGDNDETVSGECNSKNSNESVEFKVSNVEGDKYNGNSMSINGCTVNSSSNANNEKIVLKITLQDNSTINVPVSLNADDTDYIVKVIGMNPNKGEYPIFLEEFYDLAYANVLSSYKNEKNLENFKINITKIGGVDDYQEMFREAITPWFVSEIKGNTSNVELNKLFRFHSISDGNAANTQIKISIANILPEEGLFDVQIRDFNDIDGSPIILERYNKCSMVPGSSNYIGLKIGTYNGEYANKSKYVTVEVIENDVTENSVPCGFLGYPLRKYDSINTPSLKYNTSYIEILKPNRQYFGLSDITGVDVDVFKYKGVKAYNTSYLPADGYTNGFHLDANTNPETTVSILVDGVSGYKFETPEKIISGFSVVPQISSEESMENSVYEDKRLRKFTCYLYGGFDGWDIYRDSRTNTDMYRANKYLNKYTAYTYDKEGNKENENNVPFTSVFDASTFGLKGRAINSDYYAYLAGCKQFENPQEFDINLLATPGIDYVNNLDLVNEVLDIVEDSRQGDCLYIVTTPEMSVNGFEFEVDDVIQNFINSELNTSYAATYYPWVKYYDATDKKYINLPVTKDVVRNFAYTDNVSQPWFASAGMSRGNVDCVKATMFTKLDEEDALYENMINPVKSFSSDGVKIWGNKTMYLEDTPLNRINVRRLMIRLKKLVMSATRQLIFEQNDNTVEAQFRSIVGSILANAKQNRGISDYKIQTDTSAEARDRKELPARIWVKPINSLEYISVSFVITPEGASFED